MNIAQRLRVAMEARELDVADLAQRLSIDNKRLTNWRHGHTGPTVGMIPRVAKALDVSVEWLTSKDPVDIPRFK